MFGKLMKYELRYLIRIFAPMWMAVITLCALSRLLIRPNAEGTMYLEGIQAMVPLLILMLAVIAILTMMVAAAVVLLQRFYKGIYGDEGYLMFTLPVTTGSLIHSKALSAVLMLVISEVITVVGVLIMVSYKEIWQLTGQTFGELFKFAMAMNGLSTAQACVLVFWMVVAGVFVVTQGIYTVYFAISVGQLWKKHPIVGAIAAYYAITLLVGGLQAVLTEVFGASAMEVIFNLMGGGNTQYSAALAVILIAAALYSMMVTGIAFLGTKMILDRRLNIQ